MTVAVRDRRVRGRTDHASGLRRLGLVVQGERSLLSNSVGTLAHLRRGWVAGAVLFPSASMTAFAVVQRP